MTIATTASRAANQELLQFHPLADDIFPPMAGEEFDELVADIKANGLLEDIVLYDGMILDGRNRYRACLAAGVPVTTVKPDIKDPTAYVISANIRRRHLTAEQKRDLIAKLIKMQPEKSNRRIAKATGVSHPHVAKVRADMEQAGDVETVTTSIDTKGRKQPARRISAAAGEQEACDRGRSENSEPAPEGDAESPVVPEGLRNLIKFVNTTKAVAGRWPKIIKTLASRRFDDEEWGELRKTLELLGRHVNAALSAIDAARHGGAGRHATGGVAGGVKGRPAGNDVDPEASAERRKQGFRRPGRSSSSGGAS